MNPGHTSVYDSLASLRNTFADDLSVSVGHAFVSGATVLGEFITALVVTNEAVAIAAPSSIAIHVANVEGIRTKVVIMSKIINIYELKQTDL